MSGKAESNPVNKTAANGATGGGAGGGSVRASSLSALPPPKPSTAAASAAMTPRRVDPSALDAFAFRGNAASGSVTPKLQLPPATGSSVFDAIELSDDEFDAGTASAPVEIDASGDEPLIARARKKQAERNARKTKFIDAKEAAVSAAAASGPSASGYEQPTTHRPPPFADLTPLLQ